jgi:hypothetical protein
MLLLLLLPLLLLLLLLLLLWLPLLQVRQQVAGLRYEELMGLLASGNPAQQEEVLALHYPQLQLVVGKWDVGAVADMIQDINASLI